MRMGFDKWWLLPFGILTASALIASSIIVFEPSYVSRSPAGVVERAVNEPTEMSEPAADCSGASANDYACHQEHYQGLVRDSGVEAAFAELKDQHTENDFVKSNCHQLTHVIGRAALERYGDVAGAYGRGDDFCASGYYHGATEAVVAKIGADQILEEADTLCAELREDQEHSFYHYNCVHGLGHGFMGVLENELLESLEACDTLADEWEKDPCYAGVFMQNMMAGDDPSHPTKYLKADQPLYPCTDVETKYKDPCYRIQTSYALRTQGNDFARVFGLCATVEEDSRPACYQGLGGYAAVQSIQQNTADTAQNRSTATLCMLREDYEARSNCVVGAVKYYVLHYRSDMQAEAFCESFDADLRTICLQAGEEFYESLQT